MLYFFPASLTTNNEGTKQNLRLSPSDVKYIEKIYPGGEETPEDFYENAFGITIEEARKKYGGPGDDKTFGSTKVSWVRKIFKPPGLYIFIGVCVLLFVVIILSISLGGRKN